MHNLKHWVIFRTFFGLARVPAESEPRESEYKTNDGNGRNYIYGHALIWLAESLAIPSVFLRLSALSAQSLHLFQPLP